MIVGINVLFSLLALSDKRKSINKDLERGKKNALQKNSSKFGTNMTRNEVLHELNIDLKESVWNWRYRLVFEENSGQIM